MPAPTAFVPLHKTTDKLWMTARAFKLRKPPQPRLCPPFDASGAHTDISDVPDYYKLLRDAFDKRDWKCANLILRGLSIHPDENLYVYKYEPIRPNPINIDVVFHYACINLRLDIAVWIKSKFPSQYYYTGYGVQESFTIARRKNSIDIVQWLILRFPDFINEIAEDQFQGACSAGYLEIALKIVDAFPFIDVHAYDDLAFYLACRSGQIEMVKGLLVAFPYINPASAILRENSLSFYKQPQYPWTVARRESNPRYIRYHLILCWLLTYLTPDEFWKYVANESILTKWNTEAEPHRRYFMSYIAPYLHNLEHRHLMHLECPIPCSTQKRHQRRNKVGAPAGMDLDDEEEGVFQSLFGSAPP